MRIWTFEEHCWGLAAAPGSQAPSPRMQIGSERCGGPGSPPLWAGAWETSGVARTDTDWVWHCVQEARRSFSFALFFSFSISKKEPICMKGPSSALRSPSNSPRFCCAPRPPPPRFLLSLISFFMLHILTPSFSLRLKAADFCFLCLLLLSSLLFGCWPVNLILSITTLKNSFCPLSLVANRCYSKTLRAIKSLSVSLTLCHILSPRLCPLKSNSLPHGDFKSLGLGLWSHPAQHWAFTQDLASTLLILRAVVHKVAPMCIIRRMFYRIVRK